MVKCPQVSFFQNSRSTGKNWSPPRMVKQVMTTMKKTQALFRYYWNGGEFNDILCTKYFRDNLTLVMDLYYHLSSIIIGYSSTNWVVTSQRGNESHRWKEAEPVHMGCTECTRLHF